MREPDACAIGGDGGVDPGALRPRLALTRLSNERLGATLCELGDTGTAPLGLAVPSRSKENHNGQSSLPGRRDTEPLRLSALSAPSEEVPVGIATSAPSENAPLRLTPSSPGKEVPCGLTSSPGTEDQKKNEKRDEGPSEAELAGIAVAMIRSAPYKTNKENISDWMALSERDRGMWLLRMRDGVLGAGKSLTMAKLAKIGQATARERER